ncbi:MAG TPA: tRNA uridine-5-carboxymethylaminomethyl(34) synthesis GTPase MnmE [Acidobacteriaceae bacterium]|nr:tRNA uridine-5-carboxymethylaminomethyl(34) synthesis GTPase MnmE [Acidobacteriaceae bacterium]
MALDGSGVDTIVAISTPPGRGGIGIVRLSGPEALEIAARLVTLERPLEHARARRVRVVDIEDREKSIDEAVVTAFLGPRSYTGEMVVEIAAHGSPVVLEAMVRGALAEGARMGLAVRLARPGEFTQRAFLAGRIDLTQAEAVGDLIAAQTLEQARVAAQQMGGSMARRVTPAKSGLLHLIALLEAGMDFASGELDDVEIVPPAVIAGAIEGVERPLAELAASFRRGQLLRNGAAIALIGPPNAGKSSLFNRLLERERAIVTPLPGTTRDTVEESLALGGIPLRLIDTAGLRGGLDEAGIDVAEMQGIARSHEALADADLVLLIHDATLAVTVGELRLEASLAGRPHLVIYNKVDLLVGEAEPVDEVELGGGAAIRTSALTGEGLGAVREAVLAQLGAAGALAESGALNNLRQQEAVGSTLAALAAAAAANDAGLPHELILMDLHRALQALDSLTGVTTPDDILARIFSTFCIGK